MKTNKNITLDVNLITAVNGTLEIQEDPRSFSGLVSDLLTAWHGAQADLIRKPKSHNALKREIVKQ